MLEGPGLIDHLRAETRELHAALDGAIRLATLDHYTRFLTATFAAVAALEPAVAAHLPALVGAERAPALTADLAELHLPPPDPLPITIASPGAAFGAAYVLEGSTLGGLVLAERVAGFTSATRYLRLRGRETGARWRQFLVALEAAPDRAACAGAARATFAHYDRAFRLHGVIG